jgi:hypothetical protein
MGQMNGVAHWSGRLPKQICQMQHLLEPMNHNRERRTVDGWIEALKHKHHPGVYG